MKKLFISLSLIVSNCYGQTLKFCEERVEDFHAGNGKTDITFMAFGDSQPFKYVNVNEDMNPLNIKAINRIEGKKWPKNFGFNGNIKDIRGVLVAGDLVEYGGTPGVSSDNGRKAETETQHFYEMYGLCGGGRNVLTGRPQLKYPIYEGYGNHDYIRNRPFNYKYHTVINLIGSMAPLKSNITAFMAPYYSHYAWKWDNVHFINLNIKAGQDNEYVNKLKKGRKPHEKFLDPKFSLPFLSKYLKRFVKKTGEGVVIMMHYPLYQPNKLGMFRGDKRFNKRDHKRFYNIIKPYNIVAIIYGHTHRTKYSTWKGIPAINVGGPWYMMKGDGYKGHVTLININNKRLRASDIQWEKLSSLDSDGLSKIKIDMDPPEVKRRGWKVNRKHNRQIPLGKRRNERKKKTLLMSEGKSIHYKKVSEIANKIKQHPNMKKSFLLFKETLDIVPKNGEGKARLKLIESIPYLLKFEKKLKSILYEEIIASKTTEDIKYNSPDFLIPTISHVFLVSLSSDVKKLIKQTLVSLNHHQKNKIVQERLIINFLKRFPREKKIFFEEVKKNKIPFLEKDFKFMDSQSMPRDEKLIKIRF